MATTQVKITAVQGLINFTSLPTVGKIVHAQVDGQARELSVDVKHTHALAIENRAFFVNVDNEPKFIEIVTQAREVTIEHGKR